MQNTPEHSNLLPMQNIEGPDDHGLSPIFIVYEQVRLFAILIALNINNRR